MIHKIPTANREEWLALRKNYIGGSCRGTEPLRLPAVHLDGEDRQNP